jgi:antirestriction protein ArdC
MEQETRTDLQEKITNALETLAASTNAAQKTEQYLAYLRTLAKFHKYSPMNIWLILFQMPDASNVAGFTTWKKLKRHVRKGEHGIFILAPCAFESYHLEIDENTGKEKKVFHNANRFKPVYVFDITQTEGEDLPKPLQWRTTGRDPILHAQLIAFAAVHSYTYFEDPTIEAEGICNFIKKTIKIQPTAGTATLIHEIVHALMHEGKFNIAKNEKETEAEAISYVVCSHFGIETNAPNYLAHWSNPELIKASATRIANTARLIIDSIVTEAE